ncbi:hypothetical protein CLOSTASPAR_04022 [[Clostridium] asparagiforme DSM 15981]|uniref:Uncharacterized protein n=1 Tax=[Clostridium] asparagiforme DSM 15981 TaxID=518636 RepID=C0D430_9FIRM|nr:hypothetical protein CLOSTASPAR_04022 [[Clostridium] asparagiforme DSM 15981]
MGNNSPPETEFNTANLKNGRAHGLCAQPFYKFSAMPGPPVFSGYTAFSTR